MGLVKVVIADNLSPIVNTLRIPKIIFAAWVAIYAFAYQIVVILAVIVILRQAVPVCWDIKYQNFRQPYLSESITSFWRRWHITSIGLGLFVHTIRWFKRRGMAVLQKLAFVIAIAGLASCSIPLYSGVYITYTINSR